MLGCRQKNMPSGYVYSSEGDKAQNEKLLKIQGNGVSTLLDNIQSLQ